MKYINETSEKIKIVIEPWAEEYGILPGESVIIKVETGNVEGMLEIQHAPEGFVFYG